MSDEYHDCNVLPPHLPEYHDKVINALAANPNQHFIIEGGIPYLVEPEDLVKELNELNDESR